ncbi:SUKH-4 family immunity protein [Streptomyces sp. NPDC001667]
MVTFAQAQERAERWVNGDVPAYLHREVRVREFDLGFVVWAEDREDGPTSDGGRARLVIARDSGETTLWPGLPVGEVIRRYEEEYGAVDEQLPPPSDAPLKRLDLEATSFLLSPPQWLQDAADAIGIPDRRPSSSSTSAAPSGPSGPAPAWSDATSAPGTDSSEGRGVTPAGAPAAGAGSKGAAVAAGSGGAADSAASAAPGPDAVTPAAASGASGAGVGALGAPAVPGAPVAPAPASRADGVSGTGAGVAGAPAVPGASAAGAAAWPDAASASEDGSGGSAGVSAGASAAGAGSKGASVAAGSAWPDAPSAPGAAAPATAPGADGASGAAGGVSGAPEVSAAAWPDASSAPGADSDASVWPDAGASSATSGAADASATPWADTNAGEDDGDRSVGLPATVLAPALSGTDEDDFPVPGVGPDAKTALMPAGSALPRTAIAPALDDPAGPGAQGPAAPAPGVPAAAPGVGVPRPPGAPGVPGQPPNAPAAPGTPGAGGPVPPGPPGAPGAPGAGAAHAAATMLAEPGGPGMPGAPAAPGQPGARAAQVPHAPGAPGVPGQPPGAPRAPGAPGAAQGPAAPQPPGPPGTPQGPGAAYAATMLATPGTPGMPAAPGAPGAPGRPPGAPPAPGAPQPPGAPQGPPQGPGGVHHAATMLAGPGTPGPGVPHPPGAPGVPGQPPGAPGAPVHHAATMLAGPGTPGAPQVPAAPQGYGYPPQPAGVPTVGPGYMAVLRYRAADGSEQQLIRRSAPGTPHPEWQILHELRAMNVPPQQVLELHTELESCDLPGGYCARMVRETWPQVRISHTAAYGRDLATRQQGMRHLIEHQGELHQVADGPARPAPNRVPLSGSAQLPPVGPDVIGRELAESFGPQGVFRFEQRAVSRQGVPDIVAQTLVWAGLPMDLGPFFWGQAQPGRPVPTLAELAAERGVRPAPDAGSYLVMGSDYGRQLCVQYGTAHIVAVPMEAGADGGSVAPQFVNTSLPQFVRSLALLGKMWRWRYGLTPEQAGRWTVDFQEQLAALDPAALASPENWWAVLVEQMWDGLF